MPVRHRKLDFYLSKIVHPNDKERIIKKIRSMMSLPRGIDSDPIDAYRLYGLQIVIVDKIAEVNKMIMEVAGRSQYVREWAQELWDLHELHTEQMKNARVMIEGLIAHGNVDGIYNEKEDTMPTKSEIAREIANEQGIPVIDILLSNDVPLKDITGFVGLPKTTTAGGGQAGSTI